MQNEYCVYWSQFYAAINAAGLLLRDNHLDAG